MDQRAQKLRAWWRPTVAPLTLAVLLAVAWIAVLAIPNALLLVAILVFTAPVIASVIGFAMLAVILIVFWRRSRISAAAFILGTAAVFLLATLPAPTRSPLNWAANVLRVIYYQDALQRQLAELRLAGIEDPVAAIDVDGFGSLSNGIAYDPTGQILMPKERRSEAWNRAVSQTELGVDGLTARHIVGNYYSWFHP